MQIEIPIKLPSLNEYINVCRRNRYQAAAYKKNIEDQIGFYLISVPRFEKPIEITFHWIESSKRRDLDNIAFGKKFILDAMVKFGKLKDDNRKCVTGFKDEFSYGNETMVVLEIEETIYGAINEKHDIKISRSKKSDCRLATGVCART